MEVIKVIFLGIIQGITEWLPISSTAHLLLFEKLFPLNVSEDFMYLFLVFIQLGSILAVVVLYFFALNPIQKDRVERNKSFTLWLKIAVASIPAAIFGFLFDDIIDLYLSHNAVIAFTLLLYGILFIVIEKRNIKTSIDNICEITYKKAFLIGLFQALAIIPGTSRSGATILGGLILCFNRKTASEFSFFMAIPVMFGASLLRALKSDLTSFTLNEYFYLLLGALVAFIVSLLVIKKLVGFVKKHNFTSFAYYRIILAVIIGFSLVL